MPKSRAMVLCLFLILVVAALWFGGGALWRLFLAMHGAR